MKKFLTIIYLISAFSISCIATPKSYTITGKVPDASFNGKKAYLNEFNGKIIDSVQIINEQFVFKGTIDEPELREILIDGLFLNFILEPGDIAATMTYRDISAKGTPFNDVMTDFLRKGNRIMSFMEYKNEEIYKRIDIDSDAKINLEEKNMMEHVMMIDSLFADAFESNKNNVFGVYVLNQWIDLDILTVEKVMALYNESGDIVKNNKVVKEIVEARKEKSDMHIVEALITAKRQAKKTEEGMPFIDVTIEKGSINGETVSLSDYIGKGKYVLVDFWASWCGPCIKEIPVIAEVYNKYKSDKFEVVSIAVRDKRSEILKDIKKYEMMWPQIIDLHELSSITYGVNGIPHIILFAPDGTILSRGLRGDELKAKVAELMKYNLINKK